MSSKQNALTGKVGGAKLNEDEFERRLAAANKNIASASAGFADWACTDVAEALRALDNLEGDGDKDEATRLMFRVAHDLKGQGTTFGYPLATQIAGLLCDVIKSSKSSPSVESAGIIRAHLAVLDLVLKQKIKGEGDAAVQQLVEKLALAAKRVRQKE